MLYQSKWIYVANCISIFGLVDSLDLSNNIYLCGIILVVSKEYKKLVANNNIHIN